MRSLAEWSLLKTRLDRFWARYRVQWCQEHGHHPAKWHGDRSLPKWEQLDRIRNKIAERSGVARSVGVTVRKEQ